MIKLYATFYATLLSISLHASELPQNVRKVLDQHASKELYSLLTEWNKIKDDRGKVSKKNWLPKYLIKYGIERVPNAQKLRKTIEKHNLNLLDVPCKYVYQVCDQGKAPSNLNSIVIAQEIERKTETDLKINLQQAQQLYCAAINAPHFDMHGFNYIVSTDGKVYIIDTDVAAMPPSPEITELSLDWLSHGSRQTSDLRINDPSYRLLLDRWFSSITGGGYMFNSHAGEWLFQAFKQRESSRLQKRARFHALCQKIIHRGPGLLQRRHAILQSNLFSCMILNKYIENF
jgi:hypothetical protein